MKNRLLRAILLSMTISLCVLSIRAFADEQRIRPGLEMPQFELKITGSREPLTNEKMLGKAYILEFWKTTCPKCQAEMPFLHDIYRQFKDKGLEIVSLSLDKRDEDVAVFRKDKWPMPWLHGLVSGGWDSRLIQTFEVKHLPRLILVGPDGKVICTNEAGDAGMRENIEKVLKLEGK